MKNKTKLRESGIILIALGIFNVLTFVSTVVGSLIDGTVSGALATVEADILVAVKVVLIVLCVIMALIAGADIFLGVKAIKVSKNPNASKITINIFTTKFFLIIFFIRPQKIFSLLKYNLILSIIIPCLAKPTF